MNNDIIKSSDMMMNVVGMVTTDSNQICTVWTKVVSKIKSPLDNDSCEKKIPIGERLAGNTRVIDLKNGVLLVETDHPGWIQYLKMYQNFILTGLHKSLPELKINTLAFRLSGSNFGLTDNYDEHLKKAQSKMDLQLEQQDKELNKLNKSENTEKKVKSAELPPELLEKFESLKKSILTNTSN